MDWGQGSQIVVVQSRGLLRLWWASGLIIEIRSLKGLSRGGFVDLSIRWFERDKRCSFWFLSRL